MAIRSEDEARRHMHSILPEPEVREKCLNVFADAIDRANVHSRDNWAVPKRRARFVSLWAASKLLVIICALLNWRGFLAPLDASKGDRYHAPTS